MLGAKESEDVLLVIKAYIKGQWVLKFYVDGGMHMCVMSEKMVNQLVLEVSGKSNFKAKMPNNVFALETPRSTGVPPE